MPTPLHNHTHKSALDGLAKPDEIAARIQELGFGAVGITDHDWVTGHLEFHKEITKADLKPILGIETYQTTGPRQTNKGFRTDPGSKEKADNFHLILLAKNEEGLRNLWAMNSEAHRSGFYYNGRVDWELLEKFGSGLVCTSACGLGLLSQALNGNSIAGDPDWLMKKFLNIFGDDFYVELSTYSEVWQHDSNVLLADIAQRYGVPVVYANDAHYAFPGQYKLHETVLCMQYQEKVSQRTEPHHTPDLYIMGEHEIVNALESHLPWTVVDEAMENSDKIAELCSVSLPEQRMHVPTFIPDKQWKNSRDMLFDLAVEGWNKKIKPRGLDNDVYMERFKSELKTIYDSNIHDYILIVWDLIREGREDYLVGPGRGSIGGSLIAYLIGIHEIDPIRYGLIFERFYNAGRKGSMPDIDLDFPTFARDPLKQYLNKKYGSEYCADIGTVNSLQPTAAIQKLGSALEVPFGDIKAISALIKRCIESGQQPKWPDIYKKFHTELAPYKKKHPELFEWAEYLHKHTFTYGVHPSGYLVSDVPLAGNFPLRWVAKDKKVVTQFDMRDAEDMGFMKIDILGLRNLDTLMEFSEIRGESFNQFYDVIRKDEDGELPASVYKLIEDGLTVGIFQIEDGSMAKWLGRQIKPKNLEEIALLTALNRPGPLKSGAAERYIDGRKGNPHPPLHPIVSEVATESYGEIIYQEQLINFFVALGYDLKEADNVRKITGKKKRDEMAKLFDDYKKRFTALGADEATVKRVWEIVEGFADYAFNKAHSVEYGAITLWTAWAKDVDALTFYLSSIRTLVREGKKKEVPRYVREMRRRDYEVLPVDINLSDVHTAIEGNGIRYGFVDVKGIGMSASKWLVDHRPFVDYDDIITQAQVPENKITLKNGTRKMAVGSGHVNRLKQLSQGDKVARIDAEEELLGFALSDDSAIILEEHAEEITENCTKLEDVESQGMGDYTIAGIIENIKEAKTKRGDRMAWVTIESDGVSAEFAVWNSELQRLSFIWRRRQAVIARVRVTDKGQNILSAKPLYSKKTEVAYAN